MTPVEALQAWLALEHEAVWFYPVVGARRSGLVDRATTSFEAHRSTRDGVVARLRELGAEPVVASLTYDAGPMSNDAEASASAQVLEARLSVACLALCGVAEEGLRSYAVKNLRRTALAELAWDAAPRAFPGLP